MRLADRVALVTGAARGLGQAFAVALTAEGADVMGLDIEAQDETAEAARPTARRRRSSCPDLHRCAGAIAVRAGDSLERQTADTR